LNHIVVIAIVVALIAAALLFFLLRRPAASAAPATKPAPSAHHDDGVAAGAATATEDVYGAFLGVAAHPDLAGPADDLTLLKGLGPKAAAQLNALGITRYAHLAALEDSNVTALDARMGVFRGRIERDRWVEQARHLAAGDKAGFEAKFGKLGG